MENPQLLEAALEYLRFREEFERIQEAMRKLKAYLEPELANHPDQEVQIGNKALYLCECESKSFDLEAAKEKLSPTKIKRLKPFITVTESFDLKAGEDHLEHELLKPFIRVKEFTQLRVKEKKPE